MKKIGLPPFALPIALLWVVSILVALTRWHPPFFTYRAFTGLLFATALVASVVWLVRGIQQEKKG